MSYELEHVEKECVCPCGKGRIVYGWGTNDWNQVREGMMEIWCKDCADKYKFTQGGLLPKDYPDYSGDTKAYEEMNRLKNILANYHGWVGVSYWSDELYDKRLHAYLTDEEIREDSNSRYKSNWAMAIGFAKDLADKYSLNELKDVQQQLIKCKYSTQLVGAATEIAELHRRYYKTVKPEKVIVPVNMAVRNYNAYKDADQEDMAYITTLREEIKNAEAIYYKDYKEYEKDRRKHLISYELKDVRRRGI